MKTSLRWVVFGAVLGLGAVLGGGAFALSAAMDAESCRISVETGRMEEARRSCPSSLSSRQALLPPDHPDLAESLAAMGRRSGA